MNTKQMESYLVNIGRPHGELVAEGVVPAGKFIEVFPGALSIYLEPVPGLSLRFWAENKKFESVIIALAQTHASRRVYQQGLPEPYVKCVTREATLALLGDPFESRGPFKMPMPMGDVGGWDKFYLVDPRHKGLVVIVKYDVSMKVVGLAFALEQTGYDRQLEEAQP